MSLLQIIARQGLAPSGAAAALGSTLQQQSRSFADYLHMDKNTERGEWWRGEGVAQQQQIPAAARAQPHTPSHPIHHHNRR